MLKPERIQQRETWNSLLRDLPYAHILQTWEWGDFKHTTTGWLPERYAYRDKQGKVIALASLLTRKIGPFAVIYVPKGPVLDYENGAVREAVLDHLQALAKQRRVIWLKIDPDVPVATGIPADEQADPDRPDMPVPTGISLHESLQKRGWGFSADQVQFRNTLITDLRQPEEQLLASMNQSTRRKIRTAEKNKVEVRPADLESGDLDTLYRLYEETGERQEFVIRPLDYYREAWLKFIRVRLGHALIAEVAGEPVAGLVLFHTGQKVWYFYGMSTQKQRDTQASYALQWAAIRWAKAQGYPIYDWWGAPDHFVESDPMWGVYRFKDGFGGTVVRHTGAWDYVPNRWLYGLYENILPRLLNLWKALRK